MTEHDHELINHNSISRKFGITLLLCSVSGEFLTKWMVLVPRLTALKLEAAAAKRKKEVRMYG